jgi:small subunit ribosomal protein S1
MAEKESLSKSFDQTQLQEEYLKTLEELEEGQQITGTIIEITDEHVFIDVGYKSEGKIPVNEFTETPKIGDEVEVVLLKKEGRSGEVVVSKKKADLKVFWKQVRDAFNDKQPVEGTFTKVIKGGFEVTIGHDVTGFCPMSKADVVRIEKPEEYVGKKVRFLIDRLYSDGRVKIVLTRRNFLEAEIAEKKEAFFTNTSIGDIVKGEVKSFTSFGAFIDLGGFDGLLHINDMSWGHVTRPKDYVKKGQEIELKVIKLDQENQKINLSLKHFADDPWSTFEDRFGVDDVVKGKITKLTDFGAFIEIEEGIEGLAHISELSWTKRVNHPKELFAIGDEVECMILGYDIHQGKVSLGVKQVMDNPWDDIESTFPVGRQLKGTIKKVTNAGAFIELEEGIEGFLHVEDLSWTKKIKNPSSMLKTGEEIEVAVIESSGEQRRIKLGVKQLSDDPWSMLEGSYPKGSVIEGEVTSVVDFGIFVKVVGGIEGLINKNNLIVAGQDIPEEEILEHFKKGDTVKALVTEINRKTQRLYLSIKEYQRSLQREELSKYIHDNEDQSDTFTLGDLVNKNGKETDEE